MRPFRFGINMFALGDADAWADKCRLAEKLGYHTIHVPDHLGMPAPLPALVRAAEVTESPRVGTFVLNAGFWKPALLAREVATVDTLTGGRLELGLGTGYVKAEFDAAGLPFESAGKRVTWLSRMVEELRPLPGGTTLLLGGHGDRMLTLAARHADVVAYTGAVAPPDGMLQLVGAEAMDERVAFFRAVAGDRADGIESNILVQFVEVTDDRRGYVDGLRAAHGVDYLTADELLEVPTLLVGTVEQIVEQLRARRERFGFSYVTVHEPAMATMAPVIEALSGG